MKSLMLLLCLMLSLALTLDAAEAGKGKVLSIVLLDHTSRHRRVLGHDAPRETSIDTTGRIGAPSRVIGI